MSILSRIKSFLLNPRDSKYLVNSRSNEVLDIDGEVNLSINGISITITEDRDITITGVRFLDVRSEALFINSDKADQLKELKLNNPEGFEDRFKVTPSHLIEEKLHETRR